MDRLKAYFRTLQPGKLELKLIISFAILGILVGLMGFSTLIISQNALKVSVGQDAVNYAAEVLSIIEHDVDVRIEEFERFSSDYLVQQALTQSNEEFAQIEDLDTQIAYLDTQWIENADEIIPLVDQIEANSLSQELRKIILFDKQRYDQAIEREIFITNQFGVNVAQTGKTSDYYQADEEWWKIAKEKGLYVRDVAYDESAGIYSTDLAVRVSDVDGNFLGVIKIVLNIQEILNHLTDATILANSNGDDTLQITLLTHDGKIIYSTVQEFEILKDISEGEIYPRLGSEDSFFITQNGLAGYEESLFSYATSKGSGHFAGLDWFLLIEQDTDVVLSPLNSLRNILFFVSSGIFAFAILFGFVVSRSISRPIISLEQATKEVEKGNFATRVTIKTKDELQQLGKTFNKTTEALGKLQEEHKQIDGAKTRFLSITSHELRSPMTPMKAQLQMLNEGYFGDLNEEQKKSLTIIERNADRLDKIIADFLEISRIEAARLKFHFKRTDLQAVVAEVIDYMKGYMPEKKINLMMNVGRLPIIEADPDRVSQVLRNLIGNAIKFTPEGKAVQVAAKIDGDYIEFSVRDEGIGISTQDQTRIFEPFYQAEQTIYRKKGGTGLGLAICRGIVESQRGKIRIESNIGKGTIFYFTIPLKPVHEIEPIKILFSGNDYRDTKLHEIFVNSLGPIGKSELEDLRRTSLINLESLLKYVYGLQNKGILPKAAASQMKGHIFDLYGFNEKTTMKQEMKMAFADAIGYIGIKEFKKVEKKLTKREVGKIITGLVRRGLLSREEATELQMKVTKIFRDFSFKTSKKEGPQ